ncbi:Intradiol ring-cleavage dioxygenase [Staphylotrichum tortipilum]|uniref:Intradiol ring-cleavage dioxygenase n=1 Tax=Staphylotrichum tortipilum TaxID=2831512 RepID=A0AAN6MSD5_9PEZI|nr:Intradiol ring-cleavage dioxygenase [Staphylotrichum longicolle]
MLFTKATAGLALLASLVTAHPGHDVAHEAAERREYLQTAKRTSLAHCTEQLRARGAEARNVARRQAVVEKARQRRGLVRRDFSAVLAEDHNKTTAGFSRDTDAATLFAGYKSCLLTPEVTQGPYYVAGEYVRSNVVETQPGVSLLIDYQVIDSTTCDPVPNVYVEIWHCNSTGVYGGVVASGNGNQADASNINNTFLRGIQPTDSDGVAQFESIFPGHYTGRTTHIHVMVHANATLQANQTLGLDNYASHVGQAFFDQSLIAAVEQVQPYAGNTQALTPNTQDSIMAEEAGTEGVDPVMEYTLLGDSVEDGLFAWIAFGIDSSRSQAVSPAVFLYKEGGQANANGNVGGPGGPGGPPTGGFPSGSARPPAGSAVPSGGAAATSSASSAGAAKAKKH